MCKDVNKIDKICQKLYCNLAFNHIPSFLEYFIYLKVVQ